MAATDPILLVKTLLSAGWVAANTDNLTPTFKQRDDLEEQRGIGSDLIRIYSGRPATRLRLDHKYNFAEYEFSVTVDGITKGTGAVKAGAHATKVREEIERIIHANQNVPDTYWDLLYIDAPFGVESEFPTYCRFIINVVAKRYGAVP